MVTVPDEFGAAVKEVDATAAKYSGNAIAKFWVTWLPADCPVE
jgi:hypothetical protein